VRKWKDERWAEDLGLAPWNGTPVHRLTETASGVLVAGTTDHGFYLVFPKGQKQPLQFGRTNGFPSDWVISTFEDREGNLWVGTGGAGLVSVRPGNAQTIGPPDQWQGRPVLSVSTDRSGALWIGTEGAGLYRYIDGRWDNFSGDAGIANPYVWSIAEDSQGDLWVGTWGGGLFVRRGERFERAPGIETVTPPMPALLRSSQGGLWIGTELGLLRYNAGSATWYGRGEKARDVRAVIEDTKGAVWFGMSGGGLGCLKNGEILHFGKEDGLSSDYVECLHFDDEGTLWIGTFGGGLTRLKKGRFSVIDTRSGLPNSDICHIEEDDEGMFWMSSLGGIIRVSKRGLNDFADGKADRIRCLTYGLSEGLPSLECSGGLQPAGCRTSDGRLWFPTTKGLVIVDPRNVTTNQLEPPVVIETFLVDDKPLATNLAAAASIVIPPGRHRLGFQFTGLSFVAPTKVRFRYRLEGLETDWMEAGTDRAVNYSFVPPGDYNFRVIAANNDGVWNETGASLAFTVLPFFWQTLWFRILAAAVLAVGGGGIVWLDARRRTRRKLERLERQRAIERERSRIARDIHDDLGASLTRITMLSQSAHGEDHPEQAMASLDQIYGTARELTRAMDEIVWAVNPKHDTLDSLATYLGKFAQDYLRSAQIRCRLDVPVQLPAWSLTAEVRHNLFLAFKEALHNVVKHAAASEVRISLTLQGAGFSLDVEDNGCGFAVDRLREPAPADPDRLAGGNGLANMKRRLEEIGGHCELQSEPKCGTKARFVVAVRLSAP
jgi:signal transduction histidine kinase/streptogramin lyase